MRTGVSAEIDPVDGSLDPREEALDELVARPDERVDGAVMVRIHMDVEQSRRAREGITKGVDHGAVAPLGEVRHRLERQRHRASIRRGRAPSAWEPGRARKRCRPGTTCPLRASLFRLPRPPPVIDTSGETHAGGARNVPCLQRFRGRSDQEGGRYTRPHERWWPLLTRTFGRSAGFSASCARTAGLSSSRSSSPWGRRLPASPSRG